VLHLNLSYLGLDLFLSKHGHISGKNLIYKYRDTSIEY